MWRCWCLKFGESIWSEGSGAKCSSVGLPTRFKVQHLLGTYLGSMISRLGSRCLVGVGDDVAVWAQWAGRWLVRAESCSLRFSYQAEMGRVTVPLAAPLLTDGVEMFKEGSFLELIGMNLLSLGVAPIILQH